MHRGQQRHAQQQQRKARIAPQQWFASAPLPGGNLGGEGGCAEGKQAGDHQQHGTEIQYRQHARAEAVQQPPHQRAHHGVGRRTHAPGEAEVDLHAPQRIAPVQRVQRGLHGGLQHKDAHDQHRQRASPQRQRQHQNRKYRRDGVETGHAGAQADTAAVKQSRDQRLRDGGERVGSAQNHADLAVAEAAIQQISRRKVEHQSGGHPVQALDEGIHISNPLCFHGNAPRLKSRGIVAPACEELPAFPESLGKNHCPNPAPQL